MTNWLFSLLWAYVLRMFLIFWQISGWTFFWSHESVACKQTFYFSFRSLIFKNIGERNERAKTSAEREQETTTTTLLALAINKSPALYILSPALDGLWREDRGSVNRLWISEVVDSPVLPSVNIVKHTQRLKWYFFVHFCPLSRNLPLYPVPVIS